MRFRDRGTTITTTSSTPIPKRNEATRTLLKASGMGSLLFLMCATSAQAARPMITDDARIVDAKACQLETWARRNQDGRNEFWAQPACNFSGNLELTVGGALTRENNDENHRTHRTAQMIQGKTLFKTLETNGWGMGLALGTMRDPTAGRGSNWYGYVPVSFSFADDRFFLHANVGWQRDQSPRRSHATWGLGTETQLTERSWVVAEMFGQADGKPFYHGGLRYWVVPDRVQVDLTYGNRLTDGGERWISLGLRFLSPACLP